MIPATHCKFKYCWIVDRLVLLIKLSFLSAHQYSLIYSNLQIAVEKNFASFIGEGYMIGQPSSRSAEQESLCLQSWTHIVRCILNVLPCIETPHWSGTTRYVQYYLLPFFLDVLEICKGLHSSAKFSCQSVIQFSSFFSNTFKLMTMQCENVRV